MSKEKIEKFILESLFNKDHVLYDSKGIDGIRNWLSDHIEQVNRDGLLILQRALQFVQEAKEIAIKTSEDLKEILKRKEWLTTSGYMGKHGTAYLSWVDNILKQLQRWSAFFRGEGEKLNKAY